MIKTTHCCCKISAAKKFLKILRLSADLTLEGKVFQRKYHHIIDND